MNQPLTHFAIRQSNSPSQNQISLSPSTNHLNPFLNTKSNLPQKQPHSIIKSAHANANANAHAHAHAHLSLAPPSFNQSQHINCIKAVPSPSPLVTPEMGERLCRMASQHYLSDYNRYKRGIHPQQQEQHQQYQLQQQQIHPPQYQQQQQQQQKQQQHFKPAPQINSNPKQYQPLTSHPLTPPLSSDSHPPSLPGPLPLPASIQPHSQPQQLALPALATVAPTPVDQTLHSILVAFVAPDTRPQPPGDAPTCLPALSLVPTPPSTLDTPAPPTVPTHSPECPGASAPPRPTSCPNPQPLLPNGPVAGQPVTEVASRPIHASTVKTSETHPMNISPIVPPELTGALAAMLRSAPSRPRAARLPIDLFELTGPESARAHELFWKYHEGRRAAGVLAPGRLGNLLLSSCPGKKVRMQPDSVAQRQGMASRAPICRDLRLDLSRAQQMGVRAIICCLDDEELGFLGSPWIEYESVARECGLEVLRIPMAEGYAPQKGIEEIDSVLENVIGKYTAQGVDVLCHCRGGVGRAGLVACCWMLRIGLVNKPIFVAEDGPTEVKEVMSMVDGTQMVPKNSVLGQVEKVIEVIRRRRSVKAIETPQQVHFIMQYANWLDSQ